MTGKIGWHELLEELLPIFFSLYFSNIKALAAVAQWDQIRKQMPFFRLFKTFFLYFKNYFCAFFKAYFGIFQSFLWLQNVLRVPTVHCRCLSSLWFMFLHHIVISCVC